MPLISVVIPTYNNSHYVLAAVNSALQQTYANKEIIVIDDGSNDGTRQILKQLTVNEKIRYHYQDNAGLSAARNAGIKLANGTYIALLDADDVWDPEKLSLQVKAFSDHRNSKMIFTDFNTFNDQGLFVMNVCRSKFRHDVAVTFEALYTRNNFILPSTVLIHKCVFADCGYFDETLRAVEDYDMWLRVVQKYDVRGMPQNLVNIRHHGTNMTRDLSRMIDSERMVIHKYKDIVCNKMYSRRVAKMFLLNATRAIHQADYARAVTLFIKGFRLHPFLFVDISVFLATMVLGNRLVGGLRQNMNSHNFLRRLYLYFYKRH